MKYVLNVKLKEKVFPRDYRRTIISFFKKSISEYMDGNYYDEFYNSGAKAKDIVWSIKFTKPKFIKDTVILDSDNIEITLKIFDEKTALVYFSSILGMKNKAFNIGNNNQITLTKIKMVREAEIVSDTVEFKILSPICIRNHDRNSNLDTYVSIENENFGTELNKKLKEDIKYFDKEIDNLLFNFSGLKMTVVPAYGLMLPVTIGTFIVKGDTRILNEINKKGVGSRKNSGFGLVEAILY